jgi:hypothetical protein
VTAYELDELWVDEAAELAGLSKVEFLRLGQFGLTVAETTENQPEQHLEVARRAAGR